VGVTVPVFRFFFLELFVLSPNFRLACFGKTVLLLLRIDYPCLCLSLAHKYMLVYDYVAVLLLMLNCC
jgi:hypothetical protein